MVSLLGYEMLYINVMIINNDYHLSDVGLLTHPLTTSTIELGSWT